MKKASKITCPETGKVWHASQGKAMAHFRSLKERDPTGSTGMDVYHCPNCGGWHVGHRKESSHVNKFKD